MIVAIFVPHVRGFESVRISRARAGDSADRNVRSRLRQLDSPASDLLRMARERGVVRCLGMLFTPMALMMSSI